MTLPILTIVVFCIAVFIGGIILTMKIFGDAPARDGDEPPIGIG